MKASLPKVLLPLSQSSECTDTILGRVIECFAESNGCRRIVVCYPSAWRAEFERYRAAFAGLFLTEGGESRQQSVHNGVAFLSSLEGASEDEVVLVHDAARCTISHEVIDRVVAGVVEHGAVTAAIAVSDSICRASQDGVVKEYVDRSALYAIQTPQGFRLTDLKHAHERAASEGVSALDDAGLVAMLRQVRVVQGDPRNLKVTYPNDLELVRESVRSKS